MFDRIVTITSCPYSRAQLIKGRLEAEGIECFLTNINLVQPDIATGVKIKINEKDTDVAFRIIEEMKGQFGEKKLPALHQLKSIRRILVPVDLSETSINACNYALGIAFKLKAEIKLLYAYFNPVVSADPYLESNTFSMHLESVIANIEKEARKQMQELKRSLQKQMQMENLGNIKIGIALERGTSDQVILNYIEDYKPGVVVMGTKGRGRSITNYIGSVTRKIMENTEIPVLAIPERSTYWGINYVNRVMYATNFDEHDFSSLRKLMTLIRPFNMKIHCVHIYSGESDPFDQAKMESLKEHFKSEYQDYDISCNMLMHIDIIQGFEDYIEKNDIDVIALTTHKRGIIDRFFNPSITKRMLFHSHIPLLVFHS
ncbi:MAG: universal stress protein [Bacteroidetes bacterium]|nr:universal stress protein [Bacteroidota bacterium]